MFFLHKNQKKKKTERQIKQIYEISKDFFLKKNNKINKSKGGKNKKNKKSKK